MALSVNGGFGSKGGSNPNLLDNGWFTVNQRGSTSYPTTSSTSYSLDRWRKGANVEIEVETDGISGMLVSGSANGISQTYEDSLKIGDMVTASVLMQNGTIYTGSGVLGDNGIASIIDNDSIKVNVRLSTFYIDFKNLNEAIHIRAVKVEYGPISTLALDSAPDYVIELAKCRRHFLLLGGDTITIGYGFCPTNALASVTIPQMLTYGLKPTNVLKNGNMYIHVGSSALLISAVSLDTNGYINCTISGATTNAPCVIRGNQSYGHIALYDSIGG